MSEKTLVSWVAPDAVDTYWLSYEDLPENWAVPTEKQSSPKFSFLAGPAEKNTVVSLTLHQLRDSIDSPVQVELIVSAVEEPPIATGESFVITKGEVSTHAELPESDLSNLLLNDLDEPEHTAPSEKLQTILVTEPRHAEHFELGSRGGWSYSISLLSTATQDSFSYKISDGTFNSDVVTVQLGLIDPGSNVAPVASDACHSVPQPDNGYEGNLSIQVSDRDDTVFNYRITRQPQHGSLELELATGAFKYTPTTAERGHVDSFEYEVNDLRGGTDRGVFKIIVGPRRIMPLGDSITRGVVYTTSQTGDRPLEADAIGYRKRLKDLLLAAGYNTDFVGPLSSGYHAGLVDSEHAGYSGWKSGDLATGRDSQPAAGDISDWLAAHPADIVLVHAGTNDHSANASVVTPLLNAVQSWGSNNNPNLQLFIASIVDQRRDISSRGYLDSFNAGIAALAPTYQPNAFYVDQYSALNWQTDITNYNIGITGLHPTQAGYEKMAQRWYDALISSQVLHKCN